MCPRPPSTPRLFRRPTTGPSPSPAPRSPRSGHCTAPRWRPCCPSMPLPAPAPGPAPGPAPVAAADPLAPLDAVDVPAPALDVANQAVTAQLPAPEGVPHLASPENLPPGTSDRAGGTESGPERDLPARAVARGALPGDQRQRRAARAGPAAADHGCPAGGRPGGSEHAARPGCRGPGRRSCCTLRSSRCRPPDSWRPPDSCAQKPLVRTRSWVLCTTVRLGLTARLLTPRPRGIVVRLSRWPDSSSPRTSGHRRQAELTHSVGAVAENTGASTPAAASLTASTSRAQVSKAARRWSAATAATRAASPISRVPTRWLAAIARTPSACAGHFGKHVGQRLPGAPDAPSTRGGSRCGHRRGHVPPRRSRRPPRRRDERPTPHARSGRSAGRQRTAHHHRHRGWSLPANWSSAWCTTSVRTSSPSRTPPGEPGRLTISVWPETPHSPRDRMAVGTFGRPDRRMASASPGNSKSSSGLVCAGVSSVGEMPVPPGSDHHVDAVGHRDAQRPAHRVTVGDHDDLGLRKPLLDKPFRNHRAAAVVIDAGGGTGGGDDDAASAGHLCHSPGTTADLAEHLDVIDTCGRVYGLDHVVERQCRHADRGERLHLDPGAVGGAHRGGDADCRLADFELDVDAGERKVMAQRDEVAGAFGGQDAGHPGGGQRVTLGQAAGRDQGDDLGGGVQVPAATAVR